MKAVNSKSTEVKFTRRFTTETDYEFEEVTLTTWTGEDDDVAEVLTKMKADAEAAHAGHTATPEEVVEEEEVEEEEEETETEDETEGNDDEDDGESEDESEDKPAGKKSKKGKKESSPSTEKAGKKFKKKPQVYQRTNETHKELFSGMLKTAAPDWKKSDKSKALAKQVSQDMEGEEFLDEDGKILNEFYNAVKKAMKAKK